MRKSALFLLLLIAFINSDSFSQYSGVKSYTKISSDSGSFTGTLDNEDLFGFASEGIDDLDGDGINDIVVTSYRDDDGNTNAGALWVLFMNLDGSVKSHQKISNTSGNLGSVLGTNSYAGVSVENIGDLDGDGVQDIAFGEHLDDDGGADHGAIWILFMTDSGYVKSKQKISDTQGGFTGTFTSICRFGRSITNMGDMDGDGVQDLAVGAHMDTDGGSRRGAVWILFMTDSGYVKSHQKISDTQGNFTGTLDFDDRFGASVENIGDLDYDGVNDLAVGSFWDDDGGTNRGCVWILFMTDSGYVKSHQKISDTSGDFGATLDNADAFGYSLQFMGDIDGNGDINLAVGAPFEDDGGTDRGGMYIMNLGNDGKVTSYQKISSDSGSFSGVIDNTDRFSNDLGWAGDLNHDGIEEFIVTSVKDDDGGADRGAIYIMSFNGVEITKPVVNYDVKISDTEGSFTGALDNNDFFGYGMDGIGDLDNDGIEDVAIGSYQDDDGQTDAGAVWILFLKEDGSVKSHQKISNTDGGLGNILPYQERFGSDIANIGDLDGDGVSDLAVGALWSNDAGVGKGTVYILFMTDSGYVKSHQKINASNGGFTGTIDFYDLFGSSITGLGDMDNDGIPDIAVGADRDDDGGNERGAVWVLFMTDSGYVKSHQKISDTQGGFGGTLHNDDRLGSDLESIGDLDGDGVVDLAIGSYTDDDGGTNRGSVWITFMNSNGTVKSEQKISGSSGNFNGSLDDNDVFGLGIGYVGDIENDGYQNLLVSARSDDDGGTERGAIWVLNLKTDGTVANHKKISSTQGGFSQDLDDNDWLGYRIAMVGDIDKDGLVEIITGAYKDDDGGTDRGAAYIISLHGFPRFKYDYAVTKKQLDAGYYVVNSSTTDNLPFTYDEEYYSEGYLTYRVLDKDHQELTSSQQLPVSIGDNRYVLYMSTLTGISTGYYVLELTNNKGENRYLRFKRN